MKFHFISKDIIPHHQKTSWCQCIDCGQIYATDILHYWEFVSEQHDDVSQWTPGVWELESVFDFEYETGK